MPYIHKKSSAESQHPELVEEIIREFDAGESRISEGAPRIYEEELPRGPYVHVTVLWNKWRDLPPEERSKIILDAYDKRWGRDKVMKISLALGLTEEEAERLGIETE